jgi:hypothetical protein
LKSHLVLQKVTKESKGRPCGGLLFQRGGGLPFAVQIAMPGFVLFVSFCKIQTFEFAMVSREFRVLMPRLSSPLSCSLLFKNIPYLTRYTIGKITLN